jgi:hypothetical protein
MRSTSVLLSLVAAAGCLAPVGELGASRRLGAQGGTVIAGGVRLLIPPGALRDEVEVVISGSPGAGAPLGFVQVGQAFRFAPEGLQFDAPVTVWLPAEGDLAGRDDLVVGTAASEGELYQPLASTVAPRKVSAQVEHFSVFGLLEPGGATCHWRGGSCPWGGMRLVAGACETKSACAEPQYLRCSAGQCSCTRGEPDAASVKTFSAPADACDAAVLRRLWACECGFPAFDDRASPDAG